MTNTSTLSAIFGLFFFKYAQGGWNLNQKMAHSLRIACATKLFNSGIDEKLIHERTGHRSNALLTYKKPSLEQSAEVSNLLGPCTVHPAM